MGYEITFNEKEWREEIQSDRHTILANTQRYAKKVAQELVKYSISETNRVVPGAKTNAVGNYIPKGERTLRHTHPGGWADVTGQLANSIFSAVSTHGFRVKIIEKAVTDYAAALDAKTGYSVLGGIEYIAAIYIKKYEHILWEGLDDD